MKVQPLDVVRRRPRARALIVEPDTLSTVQSWITADASDGTTATLHGPVPSPAPGQPGIVGAVYLSHPDVDGFHRLSDGEVVVIDDGGRVSVFPTHESFSGVWERPERQQ